MRARSERAAIDAIEARARHLHQPKPWCGPGHGRRESHRYQDVDIGQARHDAGLVVDHDLARHGKPCPHGLRHLRGERSGKGDFHD